MSAHPIFDAVVTDEGFDPRTIEFPDPDRDHKAHEKWFTRLEFHYSQMADRDNAEVETGMNTFRTSGRLPTPIPRKDKVTLATLDAEYEAVKNEATRKLKVVPEQRDDNEEDTK